MISGENSIGEEEAINNLKVILTSGFIEHNDQSPEEMTISNMTNHMETSD